MFLFKFFFFSLHLYKKPNVFRALLKYYFKTFVEIIKTIKLFCTSNEFR